MKAITTRLTVSLVSAVALLLAPAAASQQARGDSRWVTAWGTSQNGIATTGISNATVRLVARVTIPGEAIRIRLDNTFGKEAVDIGAAYVGKRVQKETLAQGTNRQILFAGQSSVRIPAGGSVSSDAATLDVRAQEDLAISLYIPGSGVRPSQHGDAFVTSYLTPNGGGNKAADEAAFIPGSNRPAASPFTGTTTATFWLKGIDVLSPAPAGAIVALGDSITDGWCSTVDGWDRWTDWLSVRLALAGRPTAVVNEGIGGNTLTIADSHLVPNNEPALERLDRDVLSHHGVTHVILFDGTNDIRRDVAAEPVIDAMVQISKRVRQHGLKIVAATIVPRHNVPSASGNTGWNPAKSQIRQQVNEWIRTKGGFDAVLDFDKAMRDPSHPDQNYASLHCDGIHPSPLGYFEMAKAIPLDLFKK